MKRNNIRWIMVAAWVTMIALAQCGKPGDATDTYIPNLDALPNFVNVNDASDQLTFFNLPAAGSATGTFSGNRNGTAQSGSFTGSFNHSAIELTFTSGVNNGRVFSGKISDSGGFTFVNISSPASGANAAITLSFKR